MEIANKAIAHQGILTVMLDIKFSSQRMSGKSQKKSR